MPRRLRLANLPTPIQQPERLARELGVDLWVKRDDASGGPEAGNKVRKLELLLADALDRGCDTLITCGGLQSNHARATAVLGAALGLESLLLLWTTTIVEDGGGAGVPPDPAHAPLSGNVLIDELAGAQIRLITRASYRRRGEIMQAAADGLRAQGKRPYVIPEGGSNGLGAIGYVEAMAEIRRQLDSGAAGGRPFDLVVHACGSGGTAAGVALGAGLHGVAKRLIAMAVCENAAIFEQRIGAYIAEAQALAPELAAAEAAAWSVDATAKGPAYGVATAEQLALIVRVARSSGLLLDPVYTGKAFCGLKQLCDGGQLSGQRVLFIHTGGLPGLLAQAEQLAPLLRPQ